MVEIGKNTNFLSVAIGSLYLHNGIDTSLIQYPLANQFRFWSTLSLGDSSRRHY